VTDSPRWQPWADGDLAERTRETVDAIARELPQAPGWIPDGVSEQGAAALRASLAAGAAGQALFYAYLAFDSEDEAHADRAIARLDEAADALATVPMAHSLLSGFSGIAWVTDHLRGRLFTDDGGGSSGVDDALLGLLSRSPWTGEYDLINGLTGLGVCALEGLPRPTARARLEQVVERLAERAEESAEGAAWFSRPETLPGYQREAYPSGLYNLGMSHGAAGVVALLGAACRAGLGAAGPLLERAVSWLLARRQAEGAGFCFTHFYSPRGRARPSRLAWCYGDAGTATALWIAARASGDPGWERAALEVALAAAARPPEAARAMDAGLCHGAAGLSQIFGRLFIATGDERLGAAARFWLGRALEHRTPGQGAGGFRSWSAGLSNVEDWRDDRGFLEGSAGVGLALLAAVSPVEPEWDRALLISAR
jgi:hypothetical protein